MVYNTQQNIILESNGGRGLRIQYARNPLRKSQGDSDVSPKTMLPSMPYANVSPVLSTPNSSPAITADGQPVNPVGQLMGPKIVTK